MTDRRVVLAVVIFLGTFACGGLAAATWLISVHAETGSVAIVSGLTGTALGALATVLASTKSGPTEVAPVAVVNAPTDPVPVEPTD